MVQNVEGIFSWAKQTHEKLSGFTRNDGQSAGGESTCTMLPNEFMDNCIDLGKNHDVHAILYILSSDTKNNDEVLQVLLTPADLNEKSFNLHNLSSQLQLLKTKYCKNTAKKENNVIWDTLNNDVYFCHTEDSPNDLSGKIRNGDKINYKCYKKTTIDSESNLITRYKTKRWFEFPKGNDGEDQKDRIDNLTSAYRHMVVASRCCYVSGIQGIKIAVLLGIGKKWKWSERVDPADTDTFKVPCDEAMAVLTIMDVMLDIGVVTAEMLLHNSDPLSSGAPAGRIAVGQFTRIITRLKTNAFDVFTKVRECSSTQKHEKYDLLNLIILRKIGEQYPIRNFLVSKINSENPMYLLTLAPGDFYDKTRGKYRLDENDSNTLYDKFNHKLKYLTEILPLLHKNTAANLLKFWDDRIKCAANYDELCDIWQAAIVGARWPHDEDTSKKCIKILFDCYDKYEKCEYCTASDKNAFMKVLLLMGNLLPGQIQKFYYKKFDSNLTLKKYANKFIGRPESYLNHENTVDASATGESHNLNQGIILIASQKGGVGKSSIALSIANELAKTEKVLLVEMDFGGSTLGYLADTEGKLSHYETTNHVLLGDEDTEGQLMEMWRPDKKKNLDILPSPLDHEKQRELITHLLWPTLRESFEKRLKIFLGKAGSKYSKIILDLPAEFGSEGMAAFRCVPSDVKTLLFIVGRASFNTIVPTFEWANIYGIGKTRKVALIINKGPVISQDLWKTGHGLADNINCMREHEINGFPKAKYSSYVHALMPWEDIFFVPDIPYLREIASLKDVEGAGEFEELRKIVRFTREYFGNGEKNE